MEATAKNTGWVGVSLLMKHYRLLTKCMAGGGGGRGLYSGDPANLPVADGGYLAEDIYGNLPDLGWNNLTKAFLRT